MALWHTKVSLSHSNSAAAQKASKRTTHSLPADFDQEQPLGLTAEITVMGTKNTGLADEGS